MLILILIDVQYSQKAVLALKKIRIVKITPNTFPVKFLIPTPHWGTFPPTPYCYLENPEHLCMLFSSEYQIMKYLSVMFCQNMFSQNEIILHVSQKFNDFVYFIFPFINGLKKLLHFLHFSS